MTTSKDRLQRIDPPMSGGERSVVIADSRPGRDCASPSIVQPGTAAARPNGQETAPERGRRVTYRMIGTTPHPVARQRSAAATAAQAPSPVTGPERILLVACPGGHLMQMLALRPAWQGLRARWVTLSAAGIEHLLASEDVVLAHGPTPRNIPNFLRNLRLAWTTVRYYRPDVILSTGAALAVPFFIIGRLHGVRLVYVESFTRVERPALTGRIVYPLVDAFFIQWPTSWNRRRAIYAGSVV